MPRSTRPSSSWPCRGSPPSTPPATRERTTPASDLGTTNLSVDTTADSPYITATGGTTLPWTGTLTGPDGSATVTVPSQRAWGWDYLWPAIAKTTGVTEFQAAQANIGGSGGGFSKVEGPRFTRLFVPGAHTFRAVPYLTPTDYQTIVPGLIEPTAWTFNPAPASPAARSGRAVPDVSADADPYSGYLLYSPSFARRATPCWRAAGAAPASWRRS